MDERRSGILKSNVDTVEATAPPGRRRPGLLVPLLLVAILVVLGVAAALLLTTAERRPVAAPPTAVPAPTTAAAPAARAIPPANGPHPTVNGITCDALESTLLHIHVHLAIFVNGQAQQVPYGVGVGQPWQLADTAAGPFVQDGSCFYWLHTHTEDGVINIESPTRRTFTLRDFFAVWQQPLSATQVGQAKGTVITYLNGARSTMSPPDIPLTAHALIQLDLGQDVPPLPFDFSPRD